MVAKPTPDPASAWLWRTPRHQARERFGLLVEPVERQAITRENLP
jgi:hypothetical protein